MSASSMPRVLRRAALVAVPAVAAVALATAASGPAGGPAPAPREVAEEALVLPVQVVSAEARSHYAVEDVHAGRVVNRRASDLGFERGGSLVEVRFDQGDRVEAGALLARLDTRALAAERRQQAARIRQIEAELALARATTGRRQKLHDAGHLAPQRLDEAVYAQQALEAQLGAARAALENVDVQLALSELRAPFPGILSERHADEGTVVAPGQAILRLVEAAALEVHVGVPPEAAADLEPGRALQVEVGGRRLPARVEAVLPTVATDTRTVRVVLALDDPPAWVRSGALARVALENRVASRGFWLPLDALAESRRGLWSAYVVMPGPDEGGFHVERRQVEVVHVTGQRAFVRGTLREGDAVVATGVHRLVPGQRVRPARAAEGPAAGGEG